MIEIFLLLALIGAAHAKPRGYSRKGRWQLRKVSNSTNLVLSALASGDVEAAAWSGVTTGTLRVVSIIVTWSATWAAVADGSMQFGVAHSDYTAAEIEECLESNGSMDPGDKIAGERSNRLVRIIGTFHSHETQFGEVTFNDGRPMKTRLNWLLSPGDRINVWVRNGSGTIWTSNGSIQSTGALWVKDSV